MDGKEVGEPEEGPGDSDLLSRSISLKTNSSKASLPFVSIGNKYDLGKMKSVEYCLIKARVHAATPPGIWRHVSAAGRIYFIDLF